MKETENELSIRYHEAKTRLIYLKLLKIAGNSLLHKAKHCDKGRGRIEDYGGEFTWMNDHPMRPTRSRQMRVLVAKMLFPGQHQHQHDPAVKTKYFKDPEK